MSPFIHFQLLGWSTDPHIVYSDVISALYEYDSFGRWLKSRRKKRSGSVFQDGVIAISLCLHLTLLKIKGES